MSFPIDRELSKLATKEGAQFARAVELQLIIDSLARMALVVPDEAEVGFRVEDMQASASEIIAKITGFRSSKVRAHAEHILQHIKQELEEHEQAQR